MKRPAWPLLPRGGIPATHWPVCPWGGKLPPEEEHLRADGPIARVQERAQGRDVPGRDLGEEVLTRRHEAQSRTSERRTDAASATRRVDLDADLQPSSQSATENDDAGMLAIRVDLHLGPIPERALHPVVRIGIVVA